MEKYNTSAKINWKVALSFVVYLLVQPLILFTAAGSLDWVMGWVFIGVVIIFSVVSRLLVMRKHPDLITERSRFHDKKLEGVKVWDRAIVAVIAIFGPVVAIVVAGLDQRFGWSPAISVGLQLLALMFVVLGLLLGTWAMLENKFFSAVVRIQKDRNQTVITTGPYRFLRHPAYAGGTITIMAIPLVLNSLWALIPAGLIVVVYVIRTILEDKTLLNELEGYREYAGRVRYRLLPKVW